MTSVIEQRLLAWGPVPELKTGDFAMTSGSHGRLSVSLPLDEGSLTLDFHDVRAFFTKWDGDFCPFLTFEEAAGRPSDLFKVQPSRWLCSNEFYLESESSLHISDEPWEHFCVLANERSLHIAARDSVDVTVHPG